MKSKIILVSALLLTTISCVNKPENAEEISIQNNSNSNFDLEAATKIVEQRSKEIEDALKIGDSIAVGNIFTIDTKVIGAYEGRENIIKDVHGMIQNGTTLKFKIINLWGNNNIIIEDAYVEFISDEGDVLSKGNSLLVWKKEKDKWRIFRDVYKPEKK